MQGSHPPFSPVLSLGSFIFGILCQGPDSCWQAAAVTNVSHAWKDAACPLITARPTLL